MMYTNVRLDPTTFFAVRQEALLQERMDQGATLIQRRDDGQWVERRADGSETVFPL